jgi:hypothetical protein
MERFKHPTSAWEDLLEIYITHSRRTTNKRYMAKMQHEYLNVYDYA